jgi:hypothetical protein
MATVGYTTAPTTNYNYGTYEGQQVAAWFAMPSPGGLISEIYVYARTNSGSSHAGYVCLWDDSGNLLASASCTIPGSEGWFHGTLGTPYFMVSGTGFWMGVQTSDTSTSGLYAHMNNDSGSTVDWAHNNTRPGALANISQHTSNVLGVYADYTPGGAWVWNGSSWNVGETEVWNGSSWNPGALGVQVWNGSAWNTGN